jgi:hypothetical protein
LKAVAMGMVSAITLFWPNKPNPAMGDGSGQRKQKLSGVFSIFVLAAHFPF